MYLFFVRAFNDIDHITPIVWKMNQDNYPEENKERGQKTILVAADFSHT